MHTSAIRTTFDCPECTPLLSALLLIVLNAHLCSQHFFCHHILRLVEVDRILLQASYSPLLEKFWRILLYMTEDAIAKLYVT